MLCISFSNLKLSVVSRIVCLLKLQCVVFPVCLVFSYKLMIAFKIVFAVLNLFLNSRSSNSCIRLKTSVIIDPAL